jgi:hypothetical protein
MTTPLAHPTRSLIPYWMGESIIYPLLGRALGWVHAPAVDPPRPAGTSARRGFFRLGESTLPDVGGFRRVLPLGQCGIIFRQQYQNIAQGAYQKGGWAV